MNSWDVRWRQLQGSGLYLYSRVLHHTVRLNVEGWDRYLWAREEEKPLLWSLWHGQLIPFVAFGQHYLNPRNFAVVMVGDDRGDTLGSFAAHLGGATFRVDMQGNPFAAGRAVLRVIQAMKSGRQSVIAPDGPDGPPFVPKPGVAFLARKARAIILPIGAWTRHGYQMRRWDRYLLPLPFARVHVALGEPLVIEPSDEEERLLARISEALHQARQRAQVLAGARHWR
jgi:lysophospholipid acyltransferase (LPLAT)-like uncharacterized protein